MLPCNDTLLVWQVACLDLSSKCTWMAVAKQNLRQLQELAAQEVRLSILFNPNMKPLLAAKVRPRPQV